jgi:hypothetical protein
MHAEHADGAMRIIGHGPCVRQARLAEIKQQIKLQAGLFELTGALQPVRIVLCFDGLQRDQRHVIDQQVREVLANQDVLAVHPSGVLLHSRSRIQTVHSSRDHLRVLRASSSCICAEILASRCCVLVVGFQRFPPAQLNRSKSLCRSTSSL